MDACFQEIKKTKQKYIKFIPDVFVCLSECENENMEHFLQVNVLEKFSPQFYILLSETRL